MVLTNQLLSYTHIHNRHPRVYERERMFSASPSVPPPPLIQRPEPCSLTKSNPGGPLSSICPPRRADAAARGRTAESACWGFHPTGMCMRVLVCVCARADVCAYIRLCRMKLSCFRAEQYACTRNSSSNARTRRVFEESKRTKKTCVRKNSLMIRTIHEHTTKNAEMLTCMIAAWLPQR